jgi:hypothetical protein
MRKMMRLTTEKDRQWKCYGIYENIDILTFFLNERYAKLVQWHVECRKEDEMLKHPTNYHE